MGLWSVHHRLWSVLLLPPHGEHSSHSCAASAWGPSQSKQPSMNLCSVSPSHRLQIFINFSSMGPFYRVQPFRTDCSDMGPHRLINPGSTPAPPWSSLSMGQQGKLPTGSQKPWDIPLLHHEVFHGLQVDICSTMLLHGLQGCSYHGNLCSGAWCTPSHSFFTDLVFAELLPSHSHSCLPIAVVQKLFLVLKPVIPQALPSQ